MIDRDGSLYIDRAVVTDTGSYIVTATNVAGRSSIVFEVLYRTQSTPHDVSFQKYRLKECEYVLKLKKLTNVHNQLYKFIHLSFAHAAL